MKTTLLAVTGLSPAVVTETLWALAREKPRVLPHRVGFITTATGAARLDEALHAPLPGWDGQTVWEALRKALKAKPGELIADPPRVIQISDGAKGRSRALDDIQSPEENAAAAEFIFGEVWNVVRDKDRRLIASIAGGRKTMGALLHAAVSLIGREEDRLTHVLVDPPFENLPGFFFPGQPGGKLKDRGGKPHDPAKPRVLLADVPFVPLRNRFKELDDLPGSFHGVRREFSRQLKADAARPAVIEIEHKLRGGRLTIDGVCVAMRQKALTILHFLLDRQQKGKPFIDQLDAEERFEDWKRGRTEMIWKGTLDQEGIRHELNHLRTVLSKQRVSWTIPRRSLEFPPFRLRVS